MAASTALVGLLVLVLLGSAVEAYKYGDIVPVSVAITGQAAGVQTAPENQARVPIIHSKCPRFMQMKDIELPVPTGGNLAWMKMQLSLEDEGFISPYFTFFEKPMGGRQQFSAEKGPMLIAIYATFVVEGDDIVDVEWRPDYELGTTAQMDEERTVLIEFRFTETVEETGVLGVTMTLLAPLATALMLLAYIIFTEADAVTDEVMPTMSKGHFSPANVSVAPATGDVGFVPTPMSPMSPAAPVPFFGAGNEKSD
mmetsp:Transcript_2239/g.7979  ORF Transcript_2239/g.7979 Transcript_2239/m.7979 type:complete len:254 (+) Transcript_2239:170-931(+)